MSISAQANLTRRTKTTMTTRKYNYNFVNFELNIDNSSKMKWKVKIVK
jgi:hypothetical protein